MVFLTVQSDQHRRALLVHITFFAWLWRSDERNRFEIS
jgi:hypothetical protein